MPNSTTKTVCIVGLGYVGLPLASAFDEEGLDVIGFDVDEEKIAELSEGRDPTGEIGDDVVSKSGIEFTTDPAPIERADYAIITVPTPVDSMKNPNLDFVESAGRTVGEHLSTGTTVVLESTVYPGVTRDVLGPAIEEASGLTQGEEFNMGYSPERLSPGTDKSLREVKKIVSGDTDETLEDLAALYGTIIDAGLYHAETIEAAEAAKVLENIQRDVNIAVVNELALICDHMGLDTQEVIDAASSKWNFHPYTPGLVGGHCIPVDPLFLVHGSERAGYSPKLILQAREVNEYMPKHTAELTLKALNKSGKVLQDSRLVVLGLAYKPNVGDLRTSEIGGVITTLAEYGIECDGYDPLAPDEKIRESFGIDPLSEMDFDGADGIVLATPHDEVLEEFDLRAAKEQLADDPVLVDVKGVLDQAEVEEVGYAYRKL
ncbi:nucleotide sugar dehydrogenase [Halalkalicoccus subterraneus]|uniref:nucleotide sugar dehydrogenase n=1 Tax=Halalkalicoccus subterraneus TaxID=2675002 RepID=UPI000EFBC8D8|nr:nucleotide sugar dehydrogenase [Halalkalicoccus subterraneus]